jgi:hypothetical protein
MVDMLAKLEDCDPWDFEWLPSKERKKIVPKMIGRIRITTQAMKELTMGPRKAQGTLLWP